MLNMRNDREKFRAVSVTKDLGKTWDAHPTNRNTIIEPTCNASLLRVALQQAGQAQSFLLFANPHSQKARENQSIQVSFDDGKTWPATHRLLLDEGKGRGYPSLTQINEQYIGIVYEGGECDVMFERLSLLGDLIPPEQQPLGEKVRIALIGDSTVSNYPNPPVDKPTLSGWGQVFGEFFKDTVTIQNHAASGRSSKSFRAEKRWEPVLKERPDFVFIQFGHNDQKGKGPERETDPLGSYQRSLRRYIREARAAGIRPVLVTPVARRIFEDGKPVSTLTPYADAMHIVGQQTKTPVIDLHAASFALYGRLGDAGSSDFSPSEKDRTHFSRKGATEIARLVSDGVDKHLPALRSFLK
jgi:lysophospholipase L1-like esterase